MRKILDRKIFAVFALSAFLLASIAVPAVFAVSANGNGQSGKSTTAHLYLFEKDPTTWNIVVDGAWGKMKYNTQGTEFSFVFNGHNLEAGYEYTLIYYPDPWPGTGLICLGSGTVNEGGNVHIANSLNTDDLPAAYDLNSDPTTTTNPDGKTGAKIWLVLSGDVECGNENIPSQMTGWNPTEYLFEYDLINFNDVDV